MPDSISPSRCLPIWERNFKAVAGNKVLQAFESLAASCTASWANAFPLSAERYLHYIDRIHLVFFSAMVPRSFRYSSP